MIIHIFSDTASRLSAIESKMEEFHTRLNESEKLEEELQKHKAGIENIKHYRSLYFGGNTEVTSLLNVIPTMSFSYYIYFCVLVYICTLIVKKILALCLY